VSVTEKHSLSYALCCVDTNGNRSDTHKTVMVTLSNKYNSGHHKATKIEGNEITPKNRRG